MMTMTWDLFFGDMENLLEVETGSLNKGMLLAELPNWNSMAAIGFIAWADRSLGLAVDPQALADCKSLEDLARLAGVRE
jgi:hypothetical protein